jgi:hypothetical protein
MANPRALILFKMGYRNLCFRIKLLCFLLEPPGFQMCLHLEGKTPWMSWIGDSFVRVTQACACNKFKLGIEPFWWLLMVCFVPSWAWRIMHGFWEKSSLKHPWIWCWWIHIIEEWVPKIANHTLAIKWPESASTAASSSGSDSHSRIQQILPLTGCIFVL